MPAPDHIARWREHPATMVRELFHVEPDAWQEEALEAFPSSPRIVMKACAGPGKTAVLAWLGWNFMLTRPHPIGGCTSITGPNLKANLWTELARWRARSPLLQQMFDQTSTKISLREFPDTWKLEARTWPADANATQIGNALAGLHGEYVIWLLDETGDYPDAIMPTAENIFAGNPKEAHIVQAGNPTRLAGPLYRACTSARNLWRVIEITADPDDPKRTPRVSVEHARDQIKQYGRDNEWILVRIFGQFPPSSLNALIGPAEVEAAMARMYREHEFSAAPRVIGVDVARQGDDASVIFVRQGLQAFQMIKYRNVDSIQGAGQVARKWNDWQADGCFIDATGGFGWGWVDQLRLLGKAPIPIQFSAAAHDRDRYVNKRTEMYFDAIEWIKRGGALPKSNELLRALTQTTYVHRGDRLLLEDKDQIKEKLGYSPDEADAFVITFAEPLATTRLPQRVRREEAPYDPFALPLPDTLPRDRSPGAYDPFGPQRGGYDPLA
jgi:phage terminase large subunit